MGITSDKEKYFNAYEKGIKRILDQTYNMTTTVDKIYLVNIGTIPKYLEILEKHDILDKIVDLNEKSNIKNIEKKIKNDFSDYKLESNIEIIDINVNNIKANKDKKFILVEKDFLKNMKIQDKGKKTYSIIVKKDEKYIELTGENNKKTKIILKEIEKENNKNNTNKEKNNNIRTGVYKFEEQNNDVSISYNEEQSMADDVKKEEEEKQEEDDPEINYNFRIKPKKKEDQEEIKDNLTNYDVHMENNQISNLTNNNESNNNNSLISPLIKEPSSVNPEKKSNENIERIKNAPPVKLDEIVYLIYSSLTNSNDNKDIIYGQIKAFIEENDVQNELEEIGNLDIIGNIETFVRYLLKINKSSNQNLISISQSINSNYSYAYLPNSQNKNILIDEPDESSSLIQSNNREENSQINREFNPFQFNIKKTPDCENCKKGNPENAVNYYEINLNNECNNISDCFKFSFLEKCQNCKNDFECIYKFISVPKILILKFVNPKENKKYIKFNEAEKIIDLKEYKYELIKVLYVFDDLNDKKLYTDIPDDEKNNYIPYIIFYQIK